MGSPTLPTQALGFWSDTIHHRIYRKGRTHWHTTTARLEKMVTEVLSMQSNLCTLTECCILLFTVPHGAAFRSHAVLMWIFRERETYGAEVSLKYRNSVVDGSCLMGPCATINGRIPPLSISVTHVFGKRMSIFVLDILVVSHISSPFQIGSIHVWVLFFFFWWIYSGWHWQF